MTEPNNNASEVVLTPRGPRPAANVHEIPVGGTVRRVGNETHLLDGDGNIIHIAPNLRLPAMRANSNDNTPLHYLAFASCDSDSLLGLSSNAAFSKIAASWTVPPAPTSWSGDPIFISIDAAVEKWFVGDVQAVLQYGLSAAGGGKYWGTAIWDFRSDHTYWTQLNTNVHAGEHLTAIIETIPNTNLCTASISGIEYKTEMSIDEPSHFPFVYVGIGPEEQSYDARQNLLPAGLTFGPIEVVFADTGKPPVTATWLGIGDKKAGVFVTVEKTKYRGRADQVFL